MYKFIHEKSTSALSYGYLRLRFFIFGCCLLRVIIIQSVHLFQLFTEEIVLEHNTLATSIENPKQERYAFLHWTVWSESDGLISKALCQKASYASGVSQSAVQSHPGLGALWMLRASEVASVKGHRSKSYS